jgi:hypothetical protein
MAFTLHGGRATWDCAGKRVSADPNECARLISERQTKGRDVNSLKGALDGFWEALKHAAPGEKVEIRRRLTRPGS